MTKKELVPSIAMLLVGGAFATAAWQLRLGTPRHPGPGFLPFYTNLLLTIIALLSLLRTLVKQRGGQAVVTHRLFGGSLINVVAIVVVIGAYTLVIPVLGYLPGTFLLLGVLFKIAGFQRWSALLVTALLSSVLSYLIFAYWLNVKFPIGFFGI